MVKSEDRKTDAQKMKTDSSAGSPEKEEDAVNKSVSGGYTSGGQAVSSEEFHQLEGTTHPAEKKSKKAAVKILQKEIEKLCKENNEMKDRLLRKMAEFDNFRKRTEREYGEIFARAGEDIIRKLLPVLDDLERSLSQPDDKNHMDAFRKGIELIYSKSIKTLQDAGLKLIETEGKEFDPNVHEALIQVENTDVPSNNIVETFEKGYYFNGRVIRPAKVSVNK